MKPSKALFALVIALAAVTAAESAFARPRSRVSIGIGFGVPVGFGAYHYGWGPGPYYYSPYYYSPYYYPPAYYSSPVVIQQQPTVYVEQGGPAQIVAPATAAPAQPQGYWYYCADSRAYYPYVRDCPAGWQRVSPQPN